MGIRRRIFFRQECATQHRFYAEDIEIISRNEITVDALACVVDRETGDDDAINGQTGEDRVAVTIIFVVRVGLDGNVGALVGRAVDFDQLRRIFHRERSQHGRIDEAEDRCIGSDAERHGNDGKRGEAGFSYELAKAEPNILEKCFHRHRRVLHYMDAATGPVWIQEILRTQISELLTADYPPERAGSGLLGWIGGTSASVGSVRVSSGPDCGWHRAIGARARTKTSAYRSVWVILLTVLPPKFSTQMTGAIKQHPLRVVLEHLTSAPSGHRDHDGLLRYPPRHAPATCVHHRRRRQPALSQSRNSSAAPRRPRAGWIPNYPGS